MKSWIWFSSLALLTAVSAWAGAKPVVFRLASLPVTIEPGQKLVLCAANVGTGELDVSLEFVNVQTGVLVAQQTVHLAPLGAGAAPNPCLTTTADAIAGGAATAKPPMGASFAPGSAAANPPPGSQTMVVGVALVRKPLLSFREAQVTASIQVLALDGNGVMRTVETIPLSRTAHPSDGAPVYAPEASPSGHHK